MKIDNLKEGMIIKNYNDLCSILDTPKKQGNSKISQLKDLERYCEFHKEGNKFVVDDIYTTIKTKEAKKLKDLEGYVVDRGLDNNYGVYSITKGNNVYIGSTVRGFRKRFLDHYHGYHNHIPSLEKVNHILINGGTFEVICDMGKNKNIKEVRSMEQKYIDIYKNKKGVILLNSSIAKKEYSKNKSIIVSKYDYLKALEILKANNITIYERSKKNEN